MDAREQKGLEIAAKSKLQQSGDSGFVPSQTGHSGTYYTVKPDPANLNAVVRTLNVASFAANTSLQSNT